MCATDMRACSCHAVANFSSQLHHGPTTRTVLAPFFALLSLVQDDARKTAFFCRYNHWAPTQLVCAMSKPTLVAMGAELSPLKITTQLRLVPQLPHRVRVVSKLSNHGYHVDA
jgi:hypothetical protein